jgi:hypothetical protein
VIPYNIEWFPLILSGSNGLTQFEETSSRPEEKKEAHSQLLTVLHVKSHLVQTTPTFISCLAAKCILNPLGYSALYPHPSSWHPWFLTVDRGRTGRGAGRRGVGVEQMGQALLEWERQREWSWDLQETCSQLYRS